MFDGEPPRPAMLIIKTAPTERIIRLIHHHLLEDLAIEDDDG